jgi:hypothetical protein
LGGNGTALGIKGASVATFGANAQTEKDTTVFGGNPNDPTSDGLGKTTADGKLTMALMKEAVAQAGPTLPQVSGDGTGVLSGTWAIVTSDGTANDKEGNLFAVIDPTGTGAYSTGTQLVATSDMVGNGKGNVVQRALRAVGISRRANNVGANAVSKKIINAPRLETGVLASDRLTSSLQPFSVKIPAGTTCTGTDAASGMTNFCLMKIANNNAAGPFGGSVAFQIASAPAAAAKREVSFSA